MFDSIGVGDSASPGILLRYAAEGLQVPPRTGDDLQVHSRALAVMQNLAQRDEGLQVLLALPGVLRAVGFALQGAAERTELPAAERKQVAMGALKTLANVSADANGAAASAQHVSVHFVAWLCSATDDTEVGGGAAAAQACPDTAERGIRVMGNWAAHDKAWMHASASVARTPGAVRVALHKLQEQVLEDAILLEQAANVLRRME